MILLLRKNGIYSDAVREFGGISASEEGQYFEEVLQCTALRGSGWN